eukprot:1157459-Pelagomonas_calceolata.AAC.1
MGHAGYCSTTLLEDVHSKKCVLKSCWERVQESMAYLPASCQWPLCTSCTMMRRAAELRQEVAGVAEARGGRGGRGDLSSGTMYIHEDMAERRGLVPAPELSTLIVYAQFTVPTPSTCCAQELGTCCAQG